MLFRVSFIIIWLVIILPQIVYGQEYKVDSLKTVLENLNDGQQKVDIFNQLCLLYGRESSELGLIYCDRAATLSEKINYPVGKAQSIQNRAGISYFGHMLHLYGTMVSKMVFLPDPR